MKPAASPERRSTSVNYESIPVEDVNSVLERMTFTPTVEASMKWLQAELEDEIKDRTEEKEEDWIDRSLVTADVKVSAKLDHKDFR